MPAKGKLRKKNDALSLFWARRRRRVTTKGHCRKGKKSTVLCKKQKVVFNRSLKKNLMKMDKQGRLWIRA